MLLIVFSVAAAVVAVDQAVKLWATYVLQPQGDLPLWEGVFHLTYVQNEGAAFGMLDGARWIFVAVTAIVILGSIIWLVLRRNRLTSYMALTAGLLLGGAGGNLIDRIAHGYVTDLFYIKLINFAVFNVADAAMVIGVLLVAVYILFVHKETPKKPTVAPSVSTAKADAASPAGNSVPASSDHGSSPEKETTHANTSPDTCS
ncbi:MAG: signal peptidase II [Christensenellales bacterium]|jgi:signal peptidase II